ncbi:MAG: hypothetical protein COB85_03130 [Bacteroidetes bacterium]|nr:MAG: hypothetical protein COB85_03130 [Bacteroidota bacterium]
MIRTLTIALALFANAYSYGQCVSTVDFNTWIQEGPPGNGNWTVGGGGTNVNQSINGEPTFFVSPDTFINVVIQGSITVGSGDDDWVGFVFGFQQPIGNSTVYDCYLFDWKQSNQGAASEGFTLNKISGNIPAGSNGTYFWDHTSDPIFQVLATDYGAGKGWVDNTTHQVELIYTSSQITIRVDGNLIFDIPGCFNPGRFGFYNYSQANVTYADFDYQIFGQYNLLTPLICKNDTGLFEFVDTTCSGIPLNIASWSWDFGDGNFSTEMNPYHSYASSGSFPVKMIITDGFGCSDSVTKTILVQAEPIANFSTTQVCYGTTTGFTDSTILLGGGSIASWSWDFGDANTSTLQNPSNFYASDGTYNVLLTVITDSGCIDTATLIIPVYAVPNADFASNDVCLYDTTFFSSTSTIGTGTISWAWDFDDLNASTQENPFNVYATDGLYNVTLTVRSDNNCSDTITQIIEIYPAPTASFTIPSVCFSNSSFFTDQSIVVNDVISNWAWIFGDGSPVISIASPSHLYTNSLSYSYNVTLIVTSASGCIDDTTITAIIHPIPVASFTNDTVCMNEASLFTDASTIANGESITTHSWDFGDGTGTANGANVSYTYASNGTYGVELTVTSDSGCTDDTVVVIGVFALPNANFIFTEVCPDDTTVFSNASTIDVVSWAWNFDDPGSSTQENPIHIYGTSGFYNVELAVVNNNGCVDTTYNSVEVYPLPEAGFTVEPGKTSQVTPFIDFVYTSIGASTYEWDMGNGDSIFTSMDTIFTYVYAEEDTATYIVQQIAINSYGCRDTFSLEVIIREDYIIFFPNAFTPNGDGINDFFIPKGIGLVSNIKSYKLSIFDRWGDKVFETEDVLEGWNGKANNGKKVAQADVYIWLVDMDLYDLGKHKAIGHLTMFR